MKRLFLDTNIVIDFLLNREERQAQKRANSFAKLQETFSACNLTDEEIRQECESVRQEMYNRKYAG